MNNRKLYRRYLEILSLSMESEQHSEWRTPYPVSYQEQSMTNPTATMTNLPHKILSRRVLAKECTRTHITHIVNTHSRSIRNPTMIAMRRLEKLTRCLLGTSDVCQGLTPYPHAEVLRVSVDRDWADDKEIRQSCRGGTVVLFYGCAVLTWARAEKTRSLSGAEAELYGIGSGAIEGLGAAQFLQE